MDRIARRHLRLAAPMSALALLLGPGAARAEAADASPPAWAFSTRAFLSGSSTHSEPAGYKVYSGIGLEAEIGRALGGSFDAALTVRTESREVDVSQGGGEDTRLGSIELLPVSLFVDFRPSLSDSLHPYLGAGVNLTLCWEKSGALDNTQLSPGVGPAVRVGLEVDLSKAVALNADVRWNLLRTDVKEGGATLATLQIDPLTLGVGVVFRL